MTVAEFAGKVVEEKEEVAEGGACSGTHAGDVLVCKAYQPSFLDTNVYASHDGLWEHDYAEAAHGLRDNPDVTFGRVSVHPWTCFSETKTQLYVCSGKPSVSPSIDLTGNVERQRA